MSKKISFCSVLKKQQLDLIAIEPKTKNQSIYFKNYQTGNHQALLGAPGTGKTFIALYNALKEVKQDKTIEKILIVRSAVQTRDIGFMPGNQEEKGDPYTLPYIDICTSLFQRSDAYEILAENKVIDFSLTSFVRGTTKDNTIIIIDEVQNMTSHEAESVLTRVGENSKLIICGDFYQSDLKGREKGDVMNFFEIIKQMDCFNITEFNHEDVVRSQIVKDFVKIKEKIK